MTSPGDHNTLNKRLRLRIISPTVLERDIDLRAFRAGLRETLPAGQGK
jgi:hypothetical protein